MRESIFSVFLSVRIPAAPRGLGSACPSSLKNLTIILCEADLLKQKTVFYFKHMGWRGVWRRSPPRPLHEFSCVDPEPGGYIWHAVC